MRWPLRLPVLLPVILICAAASCSGKDDDDDDDDSDTGGGPGGGTATGSTTSSGGTGSTTGDGCPDEVPEEYRYLWDCHATTCDGGTKVYHIGEGSSDASGNITTSERWFMFESSGLTCIETFDINGTASPYDPETFKCATCEEIYEVTWQMTSGNDCGLLWGYTFIGDKSVEKGPFNGFLMFDTHNAFGDRNEDDGMLVVTAMLTTDQSAYYQDRDYGEGTASPTSGTDGPPEAYVWGNAGACWQ